MKISKVTDYAALSQLIYHCATALPIQLYINNSPHGEIPAGKLKSPYLGISTTAESCNANMTLAK